MIPEENTDDRSSSIGESPLFPGASGIISALASWLVDPLGRSFGERCTTLPGDAASLRPPSSLSPTEMQMRILQVIARLRQPFGALLLTPNRGNVAAFTKVAAESLITVQVEDITNNLADSIRICKDFVPVHDSRTSRSLSPAALSFHRCFGVHSRRCVRRALDLSRGPLGKPAVADIRRSISLDLFLEKSFDPSPWIGGPPMIDCSMCSYPIRMMGMLPSSGHRSWIFHCHESLHRLSNIKNGTISASFIESSADASGSAIACETA